MLSIWASPIRSGVGPRRGRRGFWDGRSGKIAAGDRAKLGLSSSGGWPRFIGANPTPDLIPLGQIDRTTISGLGPSTPFP